MNTSHMGRILTLARINLLGLGASLSGAAAWFSWPTSLEWWGFGAISIAFGFAAFQLVLQAIATAWRAWEQERAVATLRGFGTEAKTSQVATTDQLEQAGMLR